MAAKISTLTDDFTGSNLDLSKWTPRNGLSTQLTPEGLGIPENGSNQSVSSVDDYDLTDSCLCANVKTTTDDGGAGFFTLSLVEEANALGFSVGGGVLTCVQVVGGAVPTVVVVPHDPKEHHFWRLCNRGSYIIWDTSANGILWQSQRREPLVFNITTLTVVASGGTGATLGGYGGGVYGVGPFGTDIGYGSKTYDALTYGGF